MQLFDRFAPGYSDAVNRSIAFSGLRHEFFFAAKARLLADIVRAHFGETARPRLLDVGCGTAIIHGMLGEIFGRISGIDVSAESINTAREAFPQNDYRVMDGREIPYADGAFDAITAICVLHHVKPEDRIGLVREMKRVTRAGGLACIIEHNPFNPLTRIAVSRCPFDKDAQLLRASDATALLQAGGFADPRSSFFLLLPFSFAWSRRIESWLGALPFGAQYAAFGPKPADERTDVPNAEKGAMAD